MSATLPPTVSLDGEAIRRIREEKKLTQLYVASVVGVTTDTVSRWENNRYPTIKRENALRLAEALECAVEKIIRPLPEEEQAIEEPAAAPRRVWWRARGVLAGLALVLLVLAGGLMLREAPPAPQPLNLLVERQLSVYAAPASSLPVRLHLAGDSNGRGFIVREEFPRGWQLVEANPPPSSLDNEEGVARWIIRPEALPRRIVYRLLVDASAVVGEQARFGGEVVVSSEARAVSAPIGGATALTIERYLWADSNGDLAIDDWEMLDAAEVIVEMQAVHMDYDLLEKIWDAGAYAWSEEQQRFIPVRKPYEER